MKIESKINNNGSWLTVILIILGWAISFPILKYAVQARVKELLNDRFFLTTYAVIAMVSIIYIIVKFNIRYIEFDDKQQKIFLTKENKVGFQRTLSFDYEMVAYSNYDIKGYSSIEVFQQGKGTTRICSRDFSSEAYSVMLKKFRSVS